jgi:hypothetical protein
VARTVPQGQRAEWHGGLTLIMAPVFWLLTRPETVGQVTKTALRLVFEDFTTENHGACTDQEEQRHARASDPASREAMNDSSPWISVNAPWLSVVNPFFPNHPPDET